jgi:hypothetical protein
MRPSTKPVRSLRLRGAALAAVLAVPLVPALVALPAAPAAAQEPSKAELAKARTAFQEAVALAAANNCAAALVKYREVAQVKNTPQVAFNTAECEARLGKLVSALGNYRVAASQAADDKNAAKVLREVPARIEELEGRIPKLTVTRGKGADTAAIELDGTELGSGQLGSAAPVDPGSHTIVAKVGNKEYLHQTVTLAEKESKTFDVKISVAAPVIEKAAPEAQPDQPAPPPRSKAPGIGVAIGGGALLITGAALLGLRQSDLGKLSSDCKNNHCPVADQSVGNQASALTVPSFVLLPAGVVAAVVGIVMIARTGSAAKPEADGDKKDGDADKDKKDKDAVWRSLTLTASAPGAPLGGLSLQGRF